MTFIVVKHRCDLPYIMGSGDIWRCDECRRYWKSYAPGNPAYNRWCQLFWLERRLRGLH